MATAPESEQIYSVVLGTAGHIDHGKSALVQALTGIHPDRLKEEQERGITIDLGFAPLVLSSGLRVGIIDVPGHERFIKNMVAGATGIDFVMLVVAADDGVMAQTREHLQIVQLLGVRDGLTVITKKDIVEQDYLELVLDDVKTLLTGTMLQDRPVVTVSSKTGEGIAELKALLETALSKLGRRAATGPFRMPIQRVFSKEGFGTVLTGVPLSGHVAIGDSLEVLPPGCQGRVKGLQAYMQPISAGQAGHSTAVNLHGPGIEKSELARGMVLATPGIFRPSALLTAHLTHLTGTPWPLKHRAPVRFHAGTAEIQGKVLLLEGEQMAAGTEGFVQILLEHPTVVVPGDHFILRHQTPLITLGGGVVLDTVPAKRKRMKEEVLGELRERLACLGRPGTAGQASSGTAALVGHILTQADTPRTVNDLCAEVGLLPQQVLDVVRSLAASQRAVAVRLDAVFTAPARLEQLLAAVRECVQGFFTEHPALRAVERPQVRALVERKLGRRQAEFCDDLVSVLKQRGQLQVESNLVSLAGREVRLEGALAAQAQQVEAALATGGLAPPSPADIATRLRIAPKTMREIVKYLVDSQKVVEATPEIVFHQAPFQRAQEALRALFAAKHTLTVSEIRQHLGMNRKYAVPLVELLDRRGFTVRSGDGRTLKG